MGGAVVFARTRSSAAALPAAGQLKILNWRCFDQHSMNGKPWSPTGKPVALSSTLVERNPEQPPPAKPGARVEGSLTCSTGLFTLVAARGEQGVFQRPAKASSEARPTDRVSRTRCRRSDVAPLRSSGIVFRALLGIIKRAATK